MLRKHRARRMRAEGMPRSILIDGRLRSVVTLPEYRYGMAPGNKGRRFPAEPLAEWEVQRLLAACSSRGHAGVRDRALIVILWRGGMRIAEALALYPKDVDLDQGTITILEGKGRRRRVIGIDPDACAVIERWMRRRRELGFGGAQPIFCVFSKNGRAGKAVYASVVREKLKRLAARAGIDKRVHPHGLRHTHAFELANEAVPVHLIQRQLGHSSLATTERYVSHLAPRQVIDAMQRRTWREQEQLTL